MRNILQNSLATALLAFIVTGCNSTPSSSGVNEQPNQTQQPAVAQELDIQPEENLPLDSATGYFGSADASTAFLR